MAENFNPRPRKEGDCRSNLCSLNCSLFQSTPSQRGRQLGKLEVEVLHRISIHALAKRATLKFTPIHFSFSFQSTPSQRGRQHFTPLPRPRWKFQSTPSQRGRHFINVFSLPLLVFQSTPSQRGRPCGHRRTALVRSISIHALVKRATDEVGAMDSYPIISIHALVKRATRRRYRAHTHRRISIHALVKRATFLILSLVLRHSNFNPRPREEGDVVTDTWSILSGSFQSTPS